MKTPFPKATPDPTGPEQNLPGRASHNLTQTLPAVPCLSITLLTRCQLRAMRNGHSKSSRFPFCRLDRANWVWIKSRNAESQHPLDQLTLRCGQIRRIIDLGRRRLPR